MDQILGTYERWVTRKDRSFLTKTSQKKLNIGKRMLESISLIKVVNKLGEFLKELHTVGDLKIPMLISFINITESLVKAGMTAHFAAHTKEWPS